MWCRTRIHVPWLVLRWYPRCKGIDQLGRDHKWSIFELLICGIFLISLLGIWWCTHMWARPKEIICSMPWLLVLENLLLCRCRKPSLFTIFFLGPWCGVGPRLMSRNNRRWSRLLVMLPTTTAFGLAMPTRTLNFVHVRWCLHRWAGSAGVVEVTSLMDGVTEVVVAPQKRYDMHLGHSNEDPLRILNGNDISEYEKWVSLLDQCSTQYHNMYHRSFNKT